MGQFDSQVKRASSGRLRRAASSVALWPVLWIRKRAGKLTFSVCGPGRPNGCCWSRHGIHAAGHERTFASGRFPCKPDFAQRTPEAQIGERSPLSCGPLP